MYVKITLIITGASVAKVKNYFVGVFDFINSAEKWQREFDILNSDGRILTTIVPERTPHEQLFGTYLSPYNVYEMVKRELEQKSQLAQLEDAS